MKFGRHNGMDARLEKLARSIQAAIERDEQRLREMQQIAGHRTRAAAQLHSVCAAFVDTLNSRLPKTLVELSPREYSAGVSESESNVFQIAISGRIVHLEFRATESLTSTERFRVPYILEGGIRAFNQDLLDLAVIPETQLFCCLEREETTWRWYDHRTQRTAPFNQEHLVSLFEKLL